MAQISSFDGVTWANISKINGVSIGMITTVNSVGNEVFEDLSTYTEVDSASDITIVTTKCTFDTMRRDANSSVYKDFGVGNIGDFTVDFEMEISASSNQSLNIVAGFSNTAAATLEDLLSANVGVAAYIDNSGGTLFLTVHEFNGDTTDTQSIGSPPESLRYHRVQRSGTTFTWDMYNTAARNPSIANVTITCAAATYRYFNVLGSRDSGTDPTQTITGYTQNYNITGF